MPRRGRRRTVISQSQRDDQTGSEYEQQAFDKDEFPAEEFVKNFCAQHNLISENGTAASEAEKKCHRISEEARELFKDHLDVIEQEEDVQSLNTDQKYERRLRRNRRSAACAKVSNAILKRAQVTMLQKFSSNTDLTLTDRIRTLEQERHSLLQNIKSLNEALSIQGKTIADFETSCSCNLANQLVQQVENNQPQNAGQIQIRLPTHVSGNAFSVLRDSSNEQFSSGLDQQLSCSMEGNADQNQPTLTEHVNHSEKQHHNQPEIGSSRQNSGISSQEVVQEESIPTGKQSEFDTKSQMEGKGMEPTNIKSNGTLPNTTANETLQIQNFSTLLSGNQTLLKNIDSSVGFPNSQGLPCVTASDVPISVLPFQSLNEETANSLFMPFPSRDQELESGYQGQDLASQPIFPCSASTTPIQDLHMQDLFSVPGDDVLGEARSSKRRRRITNEEEEK